MFWPSGEQPENVMLASVARQALSWAYAFALVLLFVLFLAYHFSDSPFLTGSWWAFVSFQIYLVGILLLVGLDDRNRCKPDERPSTGQGQRDEKPTGQRDERLTTEQGLVVFFIIGFDCLLSIFGVVDAVTNRI